MKVGITTATVGVCFSIVLISAMVSAEQDRHKADASEIHPPVLAPEPVAKRNQAKDSTPLRQRLDEHQRGVRSMREGGVSMTPDEEIAHLRYVLANSKLSEQERQAKLRRLAEVYRKSGHQARDIAEARRKSAEDEAAGAVVKILQGQQP